MKDTPKNTTDYARLTPLGARVVLVAIVVVALLGVIVTFSPLQSDNLNPKEKTNNDVALYAAEAERIHNGEDYYTAAAIELTERGYPTRSVFNWRTPLPMWLVGKLPTIQWGKVLLCSMAVLLMFMAFESLAREECLQTNLPSPFGRGGGGEGILDYVGTTDNIQPISPHPNPLPKGEGTNFVPLACMLLLSGPLLPVFLDNLFIMPVLWAGVLIAMSICAYGLNRPWLGLAFGLAALACRELALPYCLLAAAFAWRNGNRRELIGWVVGLAVWGALFALHYWKVGGIIPPDARAHSHGWLQFGGAGFVISTAQMNAYLLLLPQWITALYLVAALVGLAGWNSPLGQRMGLCVCMYLAAFAVVGQGFNQYWGALIAPLLCFGVVRLPASIRDLWHAAAFRPAFVGSAT